MAAITKECHFAINNPSGFPEQILSLWRQMSPSDISDDLSRVRCQLNGQNDGSDHGALYRDYGGEFDFMRYGRASCGNRPEHSANFEARAGTSRNVKIHKHFVAASIP